MNIITNKRSAAPIPKYHFLKIAEGSSNSLDFNEKLTTLLKKDKISYEQELIHLAVHGFLHLLRFHHEISDKEEKIMETYEAELVKKIYKAL